MRLLIVVGVVLLPTIACSGSPSDIRAARDETVERLVRASSNASQADRVLVSEMRHLLPGEDVPKTLLTHVGSHPQRPALALWRGKVGEWNIEALQTTNDSQAGCIPWGTITYVAFSTSPSDTLERYAAWRAILSAMLQEAPESAGRLRTTWREDQHAPRRARWHTALAMSESRVLTIEMSCLEGMLSREAAEQGVEADKAGQDWSFAA